MKKDRLKMILVGAGVRPSTRKDEVDSADDLDEDERLLSARSIIDAIRSNDPEALDLALEEHYRACEESDGPEDDLAEDMSSDEEEDTEY